jgi:hypothetical protein
MQYIVQSLPNNLAVHTRTSGQAHYLSMQRCVFEVHERDGESPPGCNYVLN